MPGPSQQPATSGHSAARTFRGNAGRTPDSNTSRRPVLLDDGGPGATVELHDNGSETASMGASRLVVSVVARTVLFAVLGMLAWGLLPFALGWTPTTVMTGSMEPRISAGDVVVSRPVPAGTAALGHILLVDDPDHSDKLRLHRYVENAPGGGLILRGDANSANDSSPVAPDAVHGVAVLRVPYVGLPVVWLAEKNWGNLSAVFVSVSALTMAAAAGSSETPRGGPDPAKTGSTPGRQACTARPSTRRRVRRTARRTRTVRALLSLAALPVLVTPELLMASPTHAAFLAAATHASSFTSESSYTCLSPTVQDNPSLFYAFNEGSGTTAKDSSKVGRDGTLGGTVERIPGSCAAGASPAVDLGGSAGSVSTPQSISAPNTFSLAIWFKTTPGTTAGGRLMGFGSLQTGVSALTDRHLYMTDSGGIGFGAATRKGNGDQFNASGITSSSTFNDGKWHLATVTTTPAGTVLYVDSVRIAASTGLVAERPYIGFWRIGYDSMDFNKTLDWPGAPTSAFFNGSIDNAAVYPAALTAGQVQAHFAAGR